MELSDSTHSLLVLGNNLNKIPTISSVETFFEGETPTPPIIEPSDSARSPLGIDLNEIPTT